MHHFRTNPPARLIPPAAALNSSEAYQERERTLLAMERFCRETDTPPASLGRALANDPRLLFDMRNGRTPRLRTIRKIDAFLKRQEGAHA